MSLEQGDRVGKEEMGCGERSCTLSERQRVNLLV